jgi:hypothetical protein
VRTVTDKANRSFSNMFPKDADRGALKDRLLVENGGCDALDSLSKTQELRLPVGGECAFATSQVIHGSATDLTFDRLAAVQHSEFKGHPLVVVTRRPSTLTPPIKCGVPRVLSRGWADAYLVADSVTYGDHWLGSGRRQMQYTALGSDPG